MAENLNNTAASAVFICGRFLQSDHYRVIREHGTNDWLMTYTSAGQGVYRLHGKSFHADPGDLLVLQPGAPHDYATAPGQLWEFDWVHCSLSQSMLAKLQLPEPAPGLWKIHVGDSYLGERVSGAFQRMIADSRGAEPFAAELASQALTEIMLLLAGKSATFNGRKLDSRVSETLHRMAERMAEPLHIEQLARQAGLSVSRLSHLFKEQTGQSVMEALTALRLRQAAKLLEFTDRRIAEIAGDVGFQSPFYFTERFTSFYGISPSGYRKRIEENKDRYDFRNE
ncbi:helix-turn-helix domain-containing protein [Paenibacillus thermotolerans]|uniref:helix-turn-helix domain-containing protein n=1 Tax=Paenibacillus thermotolerans TaxID=3027807 RepID=UPI002367740F|nr:MULTISPECIES: helix-turn-helix domain-containing protein [unclassified Paenibacillus]